jgi:hypothetical protein
MKLPKITIFVSAWMSGLGFGLASAYSSSNQIVAVVFVLFGGVLAFISASELSEHRRIETKETG